MRRRALILGIILNAASASQAVEWNNPPNPLVVPMQGGGTLKFVLVYTGSGDSLIGTTEFTSGLAGKSPEETPTIMTVGGGFKGLNRGKKDWFYYISATKITCSTFNAVMKAFGKPEHKFTTADDCPATGLSMEEVQSFVTGLNQWIVTNVADLPKNDEQLITYVRLPTEAEWEFAARGGTEVTKEIFDQKTPYGAQKIEDYEWVGGPTSSHNKINPVARLKPNQLGLYDMLGDASEMTCTPFQIEPGQGPVGGMVKRGGNYRTRGEDLRTSLRGEFNPFSKDGTPARYPDLGFRVVVSSLIYPDIARVQEIKEKWEEYRKSRIVPASGSDRMSPLSSRLDREADKAKSVAEAPDQAPKKENTFNESKVLMLENQIKDVSALNKKYQDNIAEIAVRQASANAHTIANSITLINYANIQINEESNGSSKFNNAFDSMVNANPGNTDVARLVKFAKETTGNLARGNIDRATKNLADSSVVYGESLILLSQLNPELVRQYFVMRINSLKEYPTQLAVTKIAMKHYSEYLQNRRYETERWKQELLNAYNSVDVK